MAAMSEKVYLQLKMPTEDAPLSDHSRIRLALETLGYERIEFPLPVLRKLYPLCRKADFDITVTLVSRKDGWVAADVEAGDTRLFHYGLAVDYGSTTVIMRLLDLNTGATLGEAKEVNGQVRYGTDILTRITYALDDPAHPEQLQTATSETFNTLLSRLAERTGIDTAGCPVMVVSGNTAMIHFLLGLDAWTVFAAPYAPIVSDPGLFPGRELGMDYSGYVQIIPAASNYVGGDIVSGVLALGLHRQEETLLFFDIGTNGELVIGNREWLLAGAGAAGPALEGYISKFGMRAAPGAIDSVSISGNELTFTALDNKKPLGICGSGIIDLLAQMRLSGWMDISGQLVPQASPRIRFIDGEYTVVYALEEESATGQPLYFSQTDIHQYLDTKAAAYTMLECLLEAAGLEERDLGHAHLSGAFAAHSDLEAAITLGFFPDLPRQKYTVHANTSLEGASALLLDRGLADEATAIAENTHCVQFASIPDFLVRMQAAKFIPHTDMNRYPSIRSRLYDKSI